MIIRKEEPEDTEKISEITIAAFRDHPISQNTEQFIIQALRNAGVLTISLVAEIDTEIVGHIAFSPITISDGTENWYGMGPISVIPGYQGGGIGSSLIHKGLAELKTIGSKGCALVGDPNFYNKFDFKSCPELIHEGIPQEFFLILPFEKNIPQGIVNFHQSFRATG